MCLSSILLGKICHMTYTEGGNQNMKRQLNKIAVGIVISAFILNGCATTNKQVAEGQSNGTQSNETLSSNSQNNEKGTFKTITAEEAKKMMDSGDPYVLVDVRTQAEFDEKHIEGAILIPNDTIDTDMPSQLSDKEAVILVYCRSGARSRQASEKLAAMGYTNVYNFGGISDWPYETLPK